MRGRWRPAVRIVPLRRTIGRKPRTWRSCRWSLFLRVWLSQRSAAPCGRSAVRLRRGNPAVGFREGGAVVQGGRSARATDGHGLSRGDRHAEGVGAAARSSRATMRECRYADGLHERGVPRSGTDHHPGEAAVHEAGDEPVSGPEGGAGIVHSDHWAMGSSRDRSLFRVSIHSASGIRSSRCRRRQRR